MCYALFIYLLNLFLAFLQPKFDPSLEADIAAQDVEEGEPGLPTSTSSSSKGNGGLMSGMFGNASDPDEEFRPFIRRLPEFKVRVSRHRLISILIHFHTVLARRNPSHCHFSCLHDVFRLRYSCGTYRDLYVFILLTSPL